MEASSREAAGNAVGFVLLLLWVAAVGEMVMRRARPDETFGRYALVSFLTYRHGHFGPRRFGPMRHLMPSPIQTNWRIYVRDLHTGREGVYFLTTATDRMGVPSACPAIA
jgi:hypothetical protein